jgi:hypothetical protein
LNNSKLISISLKKIVSYFCIRNPFTIKEVIMLSKIKCSYLLHLSILNICFAQVPPPTLLPGESWTKLFSISYDYQSNGSIRYIVQDPAHPENLCAIMMAVTDTINPQRYVYFSYREGNNWNTAAPVNSVYNQGFPCIDLTNAGQPVISLHESSVPAKTIAYKDVLFGTESFTQIGEFPLLLWTQISGISNGNIVICGTNSSGGAYSYYNGTNWSQLIQLPNTGGSSGAFSTEAGPDGLVYIFGIDYGSPSTFGNKLWTSTNSGVNFTLQTGLSAPPDFLLSGSDTLASFIDGGRQGIYVGDEIHLVYSVYSTNSEALPLPNTVWFKKAKIIHWSPSTGIDTVAGRYNMPNVTDTLLHALVTPLCQPSVGSLNGLIYVIFTAFLRGNKQLVDNGDMVNTGEIFVTYSTNNGNSWSTPVNFTNTPNIEEKHSSVIRNLIPTPGDSEGVFFIRDLKAGGWVNVPAWGTAPVYGIYKRLISGYPGIKRDLEIVKEYKLFQNYPNPFNPATTISYYIEKSGVVTLKIFNILGEEVTVLVNGYQTKGSKEINFEASNLPSGAYFYTLSADDFKDTKAMVLIK